MVVSVMAYFFQIVVFAADTEAFLRIGATFARGGLKLYYSIGEVAEMLGVSETLLRYWEKEFPTITPKKSGRNIRQYSQEDIEQVRLIHHLVKVKGMKLAAARKALRNSKGEVERNMEIVGRLQAVREELMQIKKELDGLV